jgi:hypothetical protein
MVDPVSLQSVVRFPVVCPGCGRETLISASAQTIADALSAGSPIALQAPCCSLPAWLASNLEMEQISEYAGIHSLASGPS